MTQIDQMAEWFMRRGGVATLRDIIRSGESWSYEWRARATDARKRGYFITLERGDTPSENRYRLIPPDGNQMRMAI
jgi:hypothetical protein